MKNYLSTKMTDHTQKLAVVLTKRLSALVLVVALVLFCVACSGDNTTIDDFSSGAYVNNELESNESVIEEILYTTTITVQCHQNAFFSTYDVIVCVDDEELGTLDHGATRTYTAELSEGEHCLRFTKEGDNSVDGEVDFSVSAPTDITYKISCYNDQIDVESVSLFERTDESDQQETTTTNKVMSGTTTTTAKRDTIKMPASSSSFSAKTYTEVVNELKSAGFTNVKSKGIYDLGDGWLDSLLVNTVDSVSVDGKTVFDMGEEFSKDVAIVVSFRDRESNNPNIEFKKYTAGKLLDQLDENALTAKEDHEGEYVEITGKVDNIDASGKYFSLARTDDEWSFDTIQCKITDDAQKEQLKKLKKGQTITIKGKITVVGEVLGYTVEIISM